VLFTPELPPPHPDSTAPVTRAITPSAVPRTTSLFSFMTTPPVSERRGNTKLHGDSLVIV
jgi:hypothetical protein